MTPSIGFSEGYFNLIVEPLFAIMNPSSVIILGSGWISLGGRSLFCSEKSYLKIDLAKSMFVG